MFLTNPCSVKRDIFLADLLDEGHRERVPGDDAVVHQLHEGRQSEGQQVTKTTRQHTRTKNTHHSKLHSSRWLGPVTQMAWNITRNERSAETERETERERWRGARERNSVLRPGLLEKDRSTETGREKWDRGFAMQCRQAGLQETAGSRQKASRSRAAQCGFQSGSEKAT